MTTLSRLPWETNNVYFLGFMGVGKSRIGKAFARLVRRPFLDTDELIVRRAGKSISEIFAEEGEEGFRRLETQVIGETAAVPGRVVALGGGAVLREENWKLIEASGITVCLTAPIEVLSERIGRNQRRPLLAGLPPDERLARIREMLAQRAPYYARAQFTFCNSQDRPVSEFVRMIHDTLLEKL